MSIDQDFVRDFMGFLEQKAFPAGLDADGMLQRTNIMVYALTTRLCSQMGTTLSLFDLKAQGGGGGIGPHGPRHLDRLIAYSVEASDPDLAEACRLTGSAD
jgi:hypothetical protein